jgi:exodeoxyribonuclease V alpha subunit
LLEKFEGTLDKIRFYNEDNGYLVGSLRLSDGKTLTITGNFPPLQEGENLVVSGSWQVHNRYGKQLTVEQWERLMPATEAGLKRYLASGLIKGIGPVP